MSSTPAHPHLCLVIDVDAQAGERLRAAIDAAPFASAILRPPAGRAIDPRVAKPLVELLQARGIAALVAGDARLARTLRADGVFLTRQPEIVEAYSEARDIVGGNAIVGADCGHSRHDAMEVADAGADFVAFGLPAGESDGAGARAEQADLVAWWAEIFQVPCVALAIGEAAAAHLLTEAGADFLSLDIGAGETLADIATRVRAIADTLTAAARPR